MKAMIVPQKVREPDAPQRSPTLYALNSDPAVKGQKSGDVFDVVRSMMSLAPIPGIRASTEPTTEQGIRSTT
jgi:hypothetical protein